MKQYRIKEDGFKEIRKQILVRSLPIILVAVIFAFALFSILEKNSGEGNTYSYLFTIPIALLAIIWGLSRAIKQQKHIYATYVISIDDKSITREQANTPTINLAFNEVTTITKSKGSIVIKGKSMNNTIIVPAQLERIDEVEESLRANCQEEEKPVKTKSILQKLTVPFVFLTIGLMGVVYISSNKILVGIAGLVLTVVLIWSIINIQRNKNIDKRTRRSSYWTILVLLSIIGITISKVFGPFFE